MTCPLSEGFTTILVVVDHLYKMAHFLPMVGTPAVDTANIFVNEIVRGVQFTYRFWKDLCKSLEMEVCLSSAYHPQSNGQTKRRNQTLELYLCCFCTCSQDNWASLLPCAEFAYNSIHTVTNQSPFWANYGFHPSFLILYLKLQPLRYRIIQTNFQQIGKAMQKAQDSYKKYYDRGRSNPAFKVGNKVWLSSINLKLPCP